MTEPSPHRAGLHAASSLYSFQVTMKPGEHGPWTGVNIRQLPLMAHLMIERVTGAVVAHGYVDRVLDAAALPVARGAHQELLA